MKSKICLFLSLLCIVLALCASIPAFRDTWEQVQKPVLIRNVRYAATCTELDLSGIPVVDLPELLQLPDLKKLDLRSSGLTLAQYKTLRRWFPDCEILWDVPFQDQFLPQDTQELTITSLTASDIERLDYFPQLKRIQASGCTDYAMLEKLQELRPDLDVNYRISLAGTSFPRELTYLAVSTDHLEELQQILPYFPYLESLTLTDAWGQIDAIHALEQAYPDLEITWRFYFKGLALDEFTEELDLTGIAMTVEETETLLAHLPNLTYVDMTDCGISNEEMEEMNLRHEDIKIVWTVKLGRWFRIRTDATWFMPVKYDFYPKGNDLENLKYCHDIIALDIGHMKISSCEFVAYMPKLKYLLMADTQISDLTPLTGLEELIYLELFLTYVTDCTPLLTITTLEDLNLCYTVGDPVTISQMTWLKNLWWTNCWNQYILHQTLTETYLEFASPSSTGNGWRELPNYFAQRDIFGMYYMTG